MRIPIRIAVAALSLLATVDRAAAIVRCESADGKVTYSNADCPPKTKMVRKVDESPPVIVHDRARKAAAGAADEPPVVKLSPGKPRAVDNPVQEDQELSAEIAAQQRDCEARARQLQHLQDDLAAASAEARSSAELALRRAQDEYQTLCPKRR